MTNFQVKRSLSRLRWLTPERSLLFVPVLASVGMAFALLALAVVPTWRLVRERQNLVKDLSIKGLQLPRLEHDLKQQQALQLQLEDQENRLIKMLAGTKSLDTFLSGLNLLAVQNKVSVVFTEPGLIEVLVPSSSQIM